MDPPCEAASFPERRLWTPRHKSDDRPENRTSGPLSRWIPLRRLRRLLGLESDNTSRSFRIIPGLRGLFGRGGNAWKLEETPEQSSSNPSPHKSYPDERKRQKR